MEIPNIRFLKPVIYTYFEQATIRKWIKRGIILKAGDEYTREVYISLLRASKRNVSFGNKTFLKIFYSYTSLKHTTNAYLHTTNDHFKSLWWYKLNFGLLQGKVKSHHFSERIKVKRQYFYFLYTFLEIFNWKRHWTTLLDTGWDSLLSTWIRLAPE